MRRTSLLLAWVVRSKSSEGWSLPKINHKGMGRKELVLLLAPRTYTLGSSRQPAIGPTQKNGVA